MASKDNYTYDGTTLTFNIANWKFLTEVQVVVKGLTSASGGFSLESESVASWLRPVTSWEMP